MKFFRTEDAISFHYGAILGLNEAQAGSRVLAGNLRPLKDGKFEVTGTVQLKKGEVIGLEENDVPKGLAPKLIAIGEETKAEPPAPVGDEESTKKKKAK